jgi:hypothetical protein
MNTIAVGTKYFAGNERREARISAKLADGRQIISPWQIKESSIVSQHQEVARELLDRVLSPAKYGAVYSAPWRTGYHHVFVVDDEQGNGA